VTTPDYAPDYVVQCDWCGRFVDIEKAVEWFVSQRDLDDGRVQVTSAAYCSNYCGKRGTNIPLTKG
jgi:hypothetical protein